MYQTTIFDFLRKWAKTELKQMLFLRKSIFDIYDSSADKVIRLKQNEVITNINHYLYCSARDVLHSFDTLINEFSLIWFFKEKMSDVFNTN